MNRVSHKGLMLACIAFAWCSAWPLHAGVSVTKSGNHLVYDFAVDQITFSDVKINGHTFQKASLTGVKGYEGIRYKVGEPELPVIRLLVKGQPTITVGEESTVRHHRSSPKLMPSQPSRVKRTGAALPLSINQKAYLKPQFEPKARYTVENAGSVRGQKQYLVTLYPVSYSSAKNAYSTITNFTVKVLDEDEPIVSKPETFLFVVSKDLSESESLVTYKLLKDALGFDVKVIVVEPTDKAEDIRKRIKEVYAQTNLRYVLIIGDAELVAAKSSNIIYGVTDHYYRAIDTDDYDSDINGPDVGLGRIAVKTEEQLKAVLEKYSKYEMGEFDQEDWLNKAAFIATDDQYETAESSHEYVINTYTVKQGYLGSFPNENELGGDKLYAITHKVTDEQVHETLRGGHLLIDYSGHGFPWGFDAPSLTRDDVLALKHGDATAFVVANACETGQFTVDESFGETWQRHPHGAVMYWGSMDVTYWDEDDVLERAMADAIYGDKNKETFADITSYSLSEVWKHYGGLGQSSHYWETYVTFGDPSHLLRTQKTVTPSVDGDVELALGSEFARYVIVDDKGQPISGARVSLRQADGPLVLTARSTADGEALFSLADLKEPVRFNLTVSGKNLRVRESALTIAQPEER